MPLKRLLRPVLAAVLAALAALLAAPAWSQNVVADPWIRGTVEGQTATGLFMQLLSAKGARLVGASSPVAGVVELHEMAMDGEVMRMRALPAGIELPPGRMVALQPGGLHVMLMDLKRPLKPGDTVPVTLVIDNADKTRDTPTIEVTVRALGAATPKPAAGHGPGHKH